MLSTVDEQVKDVILIWVDYGIYLERVNIFVLSSNIYWRWTFKLEFKSSQVLSTKDEHLMINWNNFECFLL